MNNMQEPNKPCRTAHVFNGQMATPSDIHLVGRSCDCSRFIMELHDCGCSGKQKKVVLKPNPHYKYATSKQ